MLHNKSPFHPKRVERGYMNYKPGLRLACGLGCFAVAFADVGKGHADDDDVHGDYLRRQLPHLPPPRQKRHQVRRQLTANQRFSAKYFHNGAAIRACFNVSERNS